MRLMIHGAQLWPTCCLMASSRCSGAAQGRAEVAGGGLDMSDSMPSTARSNSVFPPAYELRVSVGALEQFP
jgi:hypothetical protein